jgi:alkane 1-monooxygenase
MHSWKKAGYLLFLLPPGILLASHALGRILHAWWLATLFPILFLFGVIPALDLVLGKDPVNPKAEEESALRRDRSYDAMLIACLPVQVASLAFGLWTLTHAPLTTGQRALWIVSQGLLSGVLAINTGHELIHRQSPWLRRIGGLLLATVGYSTFAVEHVLGHHVHVATQDDPSTARRGDNAYAFVARALYVNIPRGFALERDKLRKTGAGWWRRSELLPLSMVSALGLVVCIAFAGGLGALFFLGQALVAIILLEVINFIEHYGLVRAPLPGGRGYVTTRPEHSWNSNFLLTNLLLFQLQRHSDHHANAARPFQVLRHMPDSPQLPFGYATMVLIALCPPLFRAIIHPRLDRLTLAGGATGLSHAEELQQG